MGDLAARQRDRLSAADRQDVEDVLDAAAAWAGGDLPMGEFIRVGTLVIPGTGRVSPGYSRYMAMICADPGDVRRDALRGAVDRIILHGGLQITRHGIFEPAEIAESGAVVIGRAA